MDSTTEETLEQSVRQEALWAMSYTDLSERYRRLEADYGKRAAIAEHLAKTEG